jgi:hypothetical protein
LCSVYPGQPLSEADGGVLSVVSTGISSGEVEAINKKNVSWGMIEELKDLQIKPEEGDETIEPEAKRSKTDDESAQTSKVPIPPLSDKVRKQMISDIQSSKL